MNLDALRLDLAECGMQINSTNWRGNCIRTCAHARQKGGMASSRDETALIDFVLAEREGWLDRDWNRFLFFDRECSLLGD